MSNRDRIMEVATDLFFRKGYPNTSVEDILEVSGVVKSNFYYHFKTKEELACAVLEARFEEFEGLARGSLLAEGMPPLQRLERFTDGLCAMQTQIYAYSGCPLGTFAAGLSEVDCEQSERFRIRISYFFRRLEGWVHACLLEAAAEGAVRDDIDANELAKLLIACTQGLFMLGKTHRDSSALRGGVGALMRLLERP